MRTIQAAKLVHGGAIEELCAQRLEVPKRALAGVLGPEQRLNALARPTRQLLDALRMIRHHAETALMPLFATLNVTARSIQKPRPVRRKRQGATFQI